MLLVAAPSLARQRPALEVGLSLDSMPGVVITVRGLLTDQVVNALESGFPLYVHYQVDLREPGGLFGGRLAQRFEMDYVVLRNPVRNNYAAETPDGRVELPSQDSLTRWVSVPRLFQLEGGRQRRYFYQVQVRARTLSDEDVDEAFAWLRTGDNPRRERPGFLSRAARRVLVQVMPLPSFALDARSEIFGVR